MRGGWCFLGCLAVRRTSQAEHDYGNQQRKDSDILADFRHMHAGCQKKPHHRGGGHRADRIKKLGRMKHSVRSVLNGEQRRSDRLHQAAGTAYEHHQSDEKDETGRSADQKHAKSGKEERSDRDGQEWKPPLGVKLSDPDRAEGEGAILKKIHQSKRRDRHAEVAREPLDQRRQRIHRYRKSGKADD